MPCIVYGFYLMEEQITQAISQVQLISFYYQNLPRIAEPHILGVCNGVTQMLVYQTGGQSKSGRLPDWRRVNIREISDLKVLDETFAGQRTVSGKHSSWDSHLAIVA
jgi:hypothetical protein